MVAVTAELKRIFWEALECPCEAERRSYLDRACGGDPALQAQVEALVVAHRIAGDFLEDPVPAPTVTKDRPPPPEPSGTLIGPYKLLEVIGEGGMGVVYRAEQTHPVRRQVALKIIKPGMDTRQVVARFEVERQALALMDHPNIAKVLDAGSTESGRPYFVMELVRGIPITDYCDREKLSIRERLGLFVQVCQAVQHAHQKGVIHRDLKPSNVLVTVIDGAAVPKVIDFGVAKAMGQQLTERTLFTAFAQLVGTPLYMSPEQAALSGVDVDTRSDIYSLGVVLYELLTGTTPFDRATLGEAAWDEVRRLIREAEPPRPSTRLSELGKGGRPAPAAPVPEAPDAPTADGSRRGPPTTLAAVSTARGTEPARLLKLMRGELDWIVMKCLEKDRSRRYETANSLARDLERYLHDEPVSAGPPSAAYRFRKFARRHKGAVAAVAAVGAMLVVTVTALAVGTVVIAQERDAARQAAEGERRMAEAAELQRREADRERRRAEANFRQARAAVDRVFTRAAEEMAGKPHMDQVRRALLVDALEFYQGFLQQKGDDPSVRREAAQTYLRVGRIDVLLGRYEEALGPLGRAQALLEDLARREPGVPAHREDLAGLHDLVSYAGVKIHDHQLTIEHRKRWLALREQLRREAPDLPEPLLREAYARVSYGNALCNNGRQREALEHYRRALALYEQYRADFPKAPDDLELPAHAEHWLGAALRDLGRREEAEQAFRRSYELRKRQAAGQPQDPLARHKLAHIASYLADLLMRSGRPGEAESLFREALKIGEGLLDDFPDNADYLHRAADDYFDLGQLLTAMGRTGEAEAALRHAIAIRTRAVAPKPSPESHRGLAWCHYELGVLLEAAGRPGEAADAFRRALDLFDTLMRQHPEEAQFQYNLGWMLATCPAVPFRDPGRAVELAKRALQRQPQFAKRWALLGIAQYRAGDFTGAIEALNKAMGLRNGGDPLEWTFLAMAHWRRGHREPARTWYEKAAAWIEATRPAHEEYGRFLAEAARTLGDAE